MKPARLLLAGMALLAVAGPAAAQNIDCDDLDDATLSRYLDDELDDVFEQLDPDASYSIAELRDQIMEALSDDGDTGEETILTFAELEDEMSEDNTTVEDVVDRALAQADLAAAGGPGFILVRGGSLEARFAIPLVKSSLFRASRAVR